VRSPEAGPRSGGEISGRIKILEIAAQNAPGRPGEKTGADNIFLLTRRLEIDFPTGKLESPHLIASLAFRKGFLDQPDA
jgi:hypothetical protein